MECTVFYYYMDFALVACFFLIHIQWRSLPQMERDWYNQNSAKIKLKRQKMLNKSLMETTEGTRPGIATDSLPSSRLWLYVHTILISCASHVLTSIIIFTAFNKSMQN